MTSSLLDKVSFEELMGQDDWTPACDWQHMNGVLCENEAKWYCIFHCECDDQGFSCDDCKSRIEHYSDNGVCWAKCNNCGTTLKDIEFKPL